MPCVARRTLSNVKSRAMISRQPEVPNLMEVMLEFTLQRVFFLINEFVESSDKLKLELQLNFSNRTLFSSARKGNRRTRCRGTKSWSRKSDCAWRGRQACPCKRPPTDKGTRLRCRTG